ncbi:MAG: hypothetical protein HQL46_08480, partial [Gammaproteobacteria bacterium]|nr:hypothetical protein [Gammaproteobacteria bacterium]
TDLRLTEKSGRQYYSWTGVDVIGLNMWVKFEMFLRGCADLSLLGFTVFDECLDILDVGINKDKDPLMWLTLFGSEMLSLNAAEVADRKDPDGEPVNKDDFTAGQEYEMKLTAGGTEQTVTDADYKEAESGDIVLPDGSVVSSGGYSTNADGDITLNNGTVYNNGDYTETSTGDLIMTDGSGTIYNEGDYDLTAVPITAAAPSNDSDRPMVAKISWMGIDILEFEFPLKPEIDVPFGVGTGQIASAQGIMKIDDMYGVDGDEYGRAPGDLPISYNFVGPCNGPKGDCGVPMNMNMPDSLMFNGHKGLPAFNSIVPNEIMADLAKKHSSLAFVENINFFAPNLIVGLVKERDQIKTSSEIVNESGHLKLDNTMQDDELAAIAKSEVYFSRPTDPLATHFNRIDGRTEYGSTFNPFWQARLVETQIPEKVIALLFQQKQIWAISGVEFSLPFGLGSFDLNVLLNDLGLI